MKEQKKDRDKKFRPFFACRFCFRGGRTCLPILLRSKSGIFFEDFGEIALVFKTGGYRDVDHGIVGVSQQTFTFFNPHHIQVFFKRRTGRLFKNR